MPARSVGCRAVQERHGEAGGGKDQAAAIRKWAPENGHKISRRGRISSNIVQAYERRSLR
ncbi:Lsr2 family DNA-binding protein [Nocardia colli]|uniref:Lsr2 family DNA-binding protein n=1 Tax=Nocardia colli TaxID=2545717 RepID=UPI0035DFBD87